MKDLFSKYSYILRYSGRWDFNIGILGGHNSAYNRERKSHIAIRSREFQIKKKKKKGKGPKVGACLIVFLQHQKGQSCWNRAKKREIADEAREKMTRSCISL